MIRGKVFLVGAGPGDPKLITVKGLECIKKADVIVYDRLAGPGLLAFARPGAEMVPAGKSPDRHTLSQTEINGLIVREARSGKVVTRLKGGDPFVFGRGGEEAEALAGAGVPFEVVPGITSAIAAPAYAGIPVTHRDFTSTLAVVTGNEDPLKEDSSVAWDKIATGCGTIVFLMGMANLPKITGRLVEHGRAPATPAALVRWGTTPGQRTLTGTLADINEKAEAAGFKNPAVIIVGDVVKLREKLNWFENRPLFGKKILVTRSREQASVLSAAIEALGGEPLEFPVIEIIEPDDFTPIDRAIEEISSFKWIIFTSASGVRAFFKRLRLHHKDARALYGAGLCAIGPKTKEALEAYGLFVDYVPGEYRAEEISEGLKDRIAPGDRVLLPRADIARKVLPESLREMGALVTEVTAYKTITAAGDAAGLLGMLRSGEIDVITFTSSSTVRNFSGMLASPDLQGFLGGVTVACIGPVTADTAREMGIAVDVVAREYTIDGLVAAILDHLGGDSPGRPSAGGRTDYNAAPGA